MLAGKKFICFKMWYIMVDAVTDRYVQCLKNSGGRQNVSLLFEGLHISMSYISGWMVSKSLIASLNVFPIVKWDMKVKSRSPEDRSTWISNMGSSLIFQLSDLGKSLSFLHPEDSVQILGLNDVMYVTHIAWYLACSLCSIISFSRWL